MINFFKNKKKSLANGIVDGVFDGCLNGWLVSSKGLACKFDVIVNGQHIYGGRAEKYREDLREMGNNGRLGFSVPLIFLLEDESYYFSDNLEIEIVTEHDNLTKRLTNFSGKTFRALKEIEIGGVTLELAMKIVQDSGIWDECYYRNSFLKEKEHYSAIEHYLLFGWKKGFKASPFFSQTFYMLHNEDVLKSGAIPLFHYITCGEKEGRLPNDFFKANEYLAANPDLVAYEGNLLGHYVQQGRADKREITLKALDTSDALINSDFFRNSDKLLTPFKLPEYNFHEEKIRKTSRENKTKVIAYYLPQFHPFEQNDKWWGKSFTEWTNVTKAKALALNHSQPRYPTDLGYYDLRIKGNIVEQARLAKLAGVDAFCLYYYWFNGTVLMESPIETIFQDKDIDTEFCICWANENWTRTWDGLDNEVLIEQMYSDEDDIEFIKHVSRYFGDARYVKVDGKPLMVIYRPSLFPDMTKTLKRWRKWCNENNIGDIHISMVQFDYTDPNKYGFDAAVEFPPHKVSGGNVAPNMRFSADFIGSAHDYSEMISKSLNKIDEGYTCYKAVTMEWDNTARRQNKASFFTNVTPGKFGRWMSGIDNIYNKKDVADKDRLLFVNAWNEWAEGTYLEPDKKNGYAYLNAVSKFRDDKLQRPKIALLVHVFYDDLVEEIISYAKNIEHDFDILITCVHDAYQIVSKRFNEEFPNSLVDIRIVQNRGRDIAPFLCNHLDSYSRYDYICKIHTKKSLHADGMNNWRGYLYDHLLGSKEQIDKIVETFEQDETLGMQYPEYSGAIKPFIDWGSNKLSCQALMKSLSLTCPDELPDFPAGSMFWFRPKVISPLIDKSWELSDFPPEEGQVDETIMHAVERCFAMIVLSKDYIYYKLSL
jgi:lipopolysaccharide biosynthesis protein